MNLFKILFGILNIISAYLSLNSIPQLRWRSQKPPVEQINPHFFSIIQPFCCCLLSVSSYIGPTPIKPYTYFLYQQTYKLVLRRDEVRAHWLRCCWVLGSKNISEIHDPKQELWRNLRLHLKSTCPFCHNWTTNQEIRNNNGRLWKKHALWPQSHSHNVINTYSSMNLHSKWCEATVKQIALKWWEMWSTIWWV